MPLAAYSLFFSLFTGSFGITKFFLKGPLPILPQNAPLGGVLSIKFFILFFLNTMFFVRTFCIESSLFTSYRHRYKDNIDPLITEEYRLVFYLIPGIVSFLINITKLALSVKPTDFRYFKKFPQFLLCPMFCPLMFEGNPDQGDVNQPPVRVWKLGSILNSFFMGCIQPCQKYYGIPYQSYGVDEVINIYLGNSCSVHTYIHISRKYSNHSFRWKARTASS